MGRAMVATDWLRVLRAHPAPRHQLLCLPPGGGSVTAYRALAERLDDGIAVVAVQYPGRQDLLHDQVDEGVQIVNGGLTEPVLP
ncbi:thioesterase domain-containing protein, partial [Nocardia sp. NPDC004604]|uniref:thioesterase domain-containing protein n=1 Tax=Nocardia sp. NPDC004604 TaxID=3157013 RepID=UPI0033A0CF95